MKRKYCKPTVEVYHIDLDNLVCTSIESLSIGTDPNDNPQPTTNGYWGRSGIWSE